ncbi:flavin reductase family protein [Streptomyces sp. M2CJ-2]|uniref:flavin reductase family protein n=1 Tax=Streptomyces sp. M2CJ-2 TaxID=2803948 RepID=UPI0027DB161A|nr:flavin reductase family protein [Streptomyces sp. M2CJ-2]
MSGGAVDSAAFRQALGHHPTGVALISSTDADGKPLGMIVGTFNSVSLDPPLVGFLPARDSASFAAIRESGRFTVNILAHDQEDVCRALSRPAGKRFEGLAWSPSGNGSPVLPDVVCSIDCSLEACTPAGDHYFVTGLVESLEVHRPVAPLLFFQGGFGGFVPGSFVAPSDAIVAESVQTVQHIRDGMRRLAHTAHGEVTVYAKVADHAVAVATVAGPDVPTSTLLGSKWPLTPPFGEVFLIGAPEAEVEQWMNRARSAGEELLRTSRERLDHAREHGWAGSYAGDTRDTLLFPALTEYGVEGVTPARQREIQAMFRAAGEDLRPVDLEPEGRYQGASLVAPIRNRHGRCELMIRLCRIPPVSGSRIEVLADELCRLAREAEESVGGSPDPRILVSSP